MICRAIPYEGQEPYIFVSYCHKDKAKIYPILEQMIKDSYRIWYDDGNHAGDDWLDNIEDHLEDCKAVIAFISDNSSLSHNCKSEVVYALKCKKKIIPVLVDCADLPKGLRMQLSHLHYLQRSHFPSDRALLDKIYEAEEYKECKAPAGSLHLKTESSDIYQPEKKDANKCGILNGLNPIHPSHGQEGAKKSVDKSVSKDPSDVKKGKVVKKVKAVRIDMNKRDHVIEEVPELTSDKHPDAKFVHDDSNLDPNDIHKNVIHKSVDPDQSRVTDIPNEHIDIDNEATVFDISDVTIVQNIIDLDNDVTVLASSHNIALLLHPAAQRVFMIKKPQTKIGRSPIKCDVVIEGNDSISKLHAEIRQYNQKYFLVDTNSTNGTYMNGERLESGKQVQLGNPAIFQLNDEMLILLSGAQTHRFIKEGSVSFLMNESGTAVKFLDTDILYLNRNNKWPDGTLSDPKIHRARDGHGHALLSQKDDGVHLVDEGPEGGNGTYLNGSRLERGESRLLANGDHIRLGDTTLEFVSITI